MEDFNAAEYDKTAGKVFAPIFPVIARQIVTRTGKTRGKCLDVGSGPGYLGIALAKITDLEVWLLDISKEALLIAATKIAGTGLENRIQTLWGDVHQIPLPDRSMDLVVSRGSLIFWQDQKRAFQEIYRLLAPGGYAYVGGGFGTEKLRIKLGRELEKKDKKLGKDWQKRKQRIISECTSQKLLETLWEAKIPHFEISLEGGLWAIIRKDKEND